MIIRIPMTRIVLNVAVKRSLQSETLDTTARIAAVYLVRPGNSFASWMIAVHMLWLVLAVGVRPTAKSVPT